MRKGREKATLVNYTYREHTGGVSGQGDPDSQKERLEMILRWWTTLANKGRDLVLLGDINLDYRKWASSTYSLKPMVDMVKQFQANTSMSQWVEEDTRVVLVAGQEQRSIIDHCYHLDQVSFTRPEVVWIGDSDHDAVLTRKIIRGGDNH